MLVLSVEIVPSFSSILVFREMIVLSLLSSSVFRDKIVLSLSSSGDKICFSLVFRVGDKELALDCTSWRTPQRIRAYCCSLKDNLRISYNYFFIYP